MVNDLHRLGPGSVGGGGGAGRRGKAQNGMNSKQTSTSEASLAVEWSLHGFPYGSQIFFRRHPPGHNLCGGETMQNNTSCAQTLLTLPVEKTISHLDPPPRVSHCFVYWCSYTWIFTVLSHNKTTFRSRTGNPAGWGNTIFTVKALTLLSLA